MHVLTQFVDQFKLHLAVEENRIKSLRLLIQSLRNATTEADYDEDPVPGDNHDHLDHRAAAADAGQMRAATPENTEAVFTRIRRSATPDASYFQPRSHFLHDLGRYEDKRRELQAERTRDCREYLERRRSLGSRELLRERMRSPDRRDDQTNPKSFTYQPQQHKADHPRPTSDKRLQHEKYSEELRKQIEEKKSLGEQERRRLQDEEDRLEIRLQKQRGDLKREYEAEMAKIRLKSRSQPDLSQIFAPPTVRKEVRSPSYVFVSKKQTAPRNRMGDAMRLRFEDKMPQQSATISTQTGDSLIEDLPFASLKTPKPEPHPRISKLLKNSQQRITPVKEKLKENQDKMLLRLASLKSKSSRNS